MTTKTEFIEALDGTEAKIKEAFKVGYTAGFEDGGADGMHDLDNEWQWFKEARTKKAQEVEK